MDREVKKRWVAALKSGEYEQGKGFLKIVPHGGGIAYCCLGVLCEIEKAPLESINENTWRFYEKYVNEAEFASTGLPSPSWLSKYGITGDDADKLVSYNDDHDWTFEAIAEFIEECM